MIWNDAAVAKLTELYKKGFTASEIGSQLGCSRNAVIGKTNRSGLRLQNKIEGFRNKPKHSGKREKEPPRSRTKSGYSGIFDRFTPYIPPEPLTPENMKCCTLLQLTDKMCRFPIGDPKDHDFHFCGNDIAGEGVVYCGYHARISYTTAAQRRAEAATKEPPYYGPQI